MAISTSLEDAIRYHVRYSLAKDWHDVSKDDLFHAIALAVKERAIEQMLESERLYREKNVKRVYYLSLEFLIGRTLGNNLINLDLMEECRQAVKGMGYDLNEIMNEETDPALGNGGLGRLAACYLDSMATVGIPGFGYGINYQFGLFKQTIENGYQREKPDRWLADGVYWQITRPEKSPNIPIYGRLVESQDVHGKMRPQWVDTQTIRGIPHDMPIVGYGGKTVNFLRLFSARTSHDFDMSIFNQGDYIKAVEDKITSEAVSKILYPGDSAQAGRQLRLIQEYFFVACAMRDILRRFLATNEGGFQNFSDKVAIQMNDTHPAIAVAELMHLLVDDHNVPFQEAWDTTVQVLGYTNHTLLPEALERWPVPLFERILPRHVSLIYEINERFLKQVLQRHPGDLDRMRRMSIVEEGDSKHIRMANLAVVGSHSVNGVAALHTELLKKNLLADFYDLWPDRFHSITNAVTPRRWVALANPGLAALLDRTLGKEWVTDLERLKALEPLAEDPAFRASFAEVKKANKCRFARHIRDLMGCYINTDSLFDIQAKRIHLYKRQMLNVLRIIHAYLRLVDDRQTPAVPQVFIFAGKAAPGYWAAKQVIKLVHNLGQVINQDPRARDWICVAFIPDYKVTEAEMMIPAADLSEQISTAGMEASGTGNMKFALNGALTIGTFDGATIEMAERIGLENMFLFGLKANEVQALRQQGYDPRGILARNDGLARVIEAIRTNRFSRNEPGIFNPLVDLLLEPSDLFVHLADLEAYIAAHEKAETLYHQPDLWYTQAILNVARMGYFSSDRAIREYAREVWNVPA